MKTYALWQVFPEAPEQNYIMVVFTSMGRLHEYLQMRRNILGVSKNYMIQEGEMVFQQEGRQWNI